MIIILFGTGRVRSNDPDGTLGIIVGVSVLWLFFDDFYCDLIWCFIVLKRDDDVIAVI